MKIAFVVQRYGNEVNGGAELHCRRVVERLTSQYEVDVLTTCAIDYQTWENNYRPGESELGGARVHRFPVDFPRHVHTFNNTYNFLVSYHLWLGNHRNTTIHDGDHVQKLLADPRPGELSPAVYRSLWDRLELKLMQRLNERFWMKMQGPYSSDLIHYLRQNRKHYDAFFFFTYNYGTTYYGLPLVGRSAALIPTVHEEACIAFSLYKKVFRAPRCILFNTHEERTFTERKFPFIKRKPNDIVGLGVDLTPRYEHDIMAQAYGIKDPYILYAGRIEESKGCSLLFESFIPFRQHYQKPLKLVLLGKAEMPIPEHPDIVALGFVSEEVKTAALDGALAFVMPSYYESLSMAILEAWLVKTPVMVNQTCGVLAAHCENSGGGLCFHDDTSFAHALMKLLASQDYRSKLGEAGYRYVKATYTWDKVMDKYHNVIHALSAPQPRLAWR